MLLLHDLTSWNVSVSISVPASNLGWWHNLCHLWARLCCGMSHQSRDTIACKHAMNEGSLVQAWARSFAAPPYQTCHSLSVRIHGPARPAFCAADPAFTAADPAFSISFTAADPALCCVPPGPHCTSDPAFCLFLTQPSLLAGGGWLRRGLHSQHPLGGCRPGQR